MTNFIAPAVNAVRQWADLGGNRTEDPQQNPFRKAKVAFAVAYPKVSNPVKLADGQRDSILALVGINNVGDGELALALSRISADTYHAALPASIKSVVTAWRAEHGENSEKSARRELLEGSASLAVIDGKLESARLAQEQAEAEHQEFDRQYHVFRSLPAKYAQLTGKIDNLELSAKQISEADYDAQITQHLEAQYNPRPGVMIAGNIGELLVAKETRDLKLKVIEKLQALMNVELTQLADDNKRLAGELDLPQHIL